MMLKQLVLIILLIGSVLCNAQTKELEDRTPFYYLDQAHWKEFDELLSRKILLDSTTIAPKYKDTLTNRLNDAGIEEYMNIKIKVYTGLFWSRLPVLATRSTGK